MLLRHGPLQKHWLACTWSTRFGWWHLWCHYSGWCENFICNESWRLLWAQHWGAMHDWGGCWPLEKVAQKGFKFQCQGKYKSIDLVDLCSAMGLHMDDYMDLLHSLAMDMWSSIRILVSCNSIRIQFFSFIIPLNNIFCTFFHIMIFLSYILFLFFFFFLFFEAVCIHLPLSPNPLKIFVS